MSDAPVGDSELYLYLDEPGLKRLLKQMHQLKLALEACGVHVEILKTRRPGRIIWQDEHQLVAEPGAKRF